MFFFLLSGPLTKDWFCDWITGSRLGEKEGAYAKPKF